MYSWLLQLVEDSSGGGMISPKKCSTTLLGSSFLNTFCLHGTPKELFKSQGSKTVNPEIYRSQLHVIFSSATTQSLSAEVHTNMTRSSGRTSFAVSRGMEGTAAPWTGTYRTLDNGGFAFQVVLRERDVTVARMVYDFDNDYDDDEDAYTVGQICLSLRPVRVFVGHSPRMPKTEFSGGYGPRFRGNTILLEMGANKYIHIGDSVRRFETKGGARITRFVSPVGNNGVPYPFAFDADGNSYLLTFEVMIVKPLDPTRDPDEYYMANSVITHVSAPFTPFDGITEFYSGRTRPSNLIWDPHPVIMYNHMQKRRDNQPMYIVQHGKKVRLTRSMYVDIMRRVGKERGLAAIKGIKTILERE
jgi:hypothetical protein